MILPDELVENIQYPTYINGSDYDSTRKSCYFKNGHIGSVTINAKGITAAANGYVKLFTLPVGYRPLVDTYGLGIDINSDAYKLIFIEQDGDVIMQTPVAMTNKSVQGNLTFYI